RVVSAWNRASDRQLERAVRRTPDTHTQVRWFRRRLTFGDRHERDSAAQWRAAVVGHADSDPGGGFGLLRGRRPCKNTALAINRRSERSAFIQTETESLRCWAVRIK